MAAISIVIMIIGAVAAVMHFIGVETAIPGVARLPLAGWAAVAIAGFIGYMFFRRARD